MLNANTMTSFQQVMNSLWSLYKEMREDRDNWGLTEKESTDIFTTLLEARKQMRDAKDKVLDRT